MNDFLQTIRISLTPLSPIHIGSGEDFEPTNYVIEDGVLYSFEPSQASLPDNLRKQLMDLANRARLMDIQKFFRDNSKLFTPHAKSLIPVATGIAREYKNKIGTVVQREADGNAVFNKLTIERTFHNPITGQALVPGSSFKGAIRTAILDKINNGKRVLDRDESKKDSNLLEKRLLQGDFATSPLRLLKIADLMPEGDLLREIKYAVNRKKRAVMDKRTGLEFDPKGVTARKECILPGQYRALVADAIIHDVGQHGDSRSTPSPAIRLQDWRELAKTCNDYYLPRLNSELDNLDERRFCHPEWQKSMNQLLTALDGRLTQGDAFLIRLGRYGGAESKTLSGDGVAQIKIMQGRGMPFLTDSRTKTVWLAANNDADRSDMQPFGWALVEVNPQADLPQLKAWCQQQTKAHPDMAAIRAKHADSVAANNLAKQQLQQERQLALEAEQALQQAEAEKRAFLAAMSEADRLRIALCEAVSKAVNQKQPGSPIAKECFGVINAALNIEADNTAPWSAAERLALAEQLAPLVKAKGMLVGKDEKAFKALFRQLRDEA